MNQTYTDYFPQDGMFPILKYISIVGIELNTVITTPLFFGLKKYEKFGPGQKPTFFNNLIISLCWNRIFWNMIFQHIFVVRFLTGPAPIFNNFTCFMLTLTRRALAYHCFLLLDGLVFVRYLFIFWMKTYETFCSEFWSKFINRWVVLFSFVYHYMRLMMPGNHLVENFICTGEDPGVHLNMPPFLRGHVETFSVILCIFVAVRIAIHKVTSNSKISTQQTIVSMVKDNCHLHSTTLCAYLLGSTFVLLILLNYHLIGLANHPDGSSRENGNYFGLFVTYFIYQNVINLVVLLVFYARSEPLRLYVRRELKSLFGKNDPLVILD